MAEYTVTTREDVVDANDGVTSLREALSLAQAHAGADTISFSASVFTPGNASIALTQGQLAITQAGGPLSINGDIDGNHTADVSIDAQGQSRIFDIQGASATQQAQVTLNGLAITGGNSTDPNSASYGNGGGIRAVNADLQITDNRITDNLGQLGGGIALSDSHVTITRSTISDNSTYVALGAGNGGGIWAGGGSLAVLASTIADNSAGGYRTASAGGGGISVSNGDLLVRRTSITGNSVDGGPDGHGGGISIQGGHLSVVRSTIDHNSVDGDYGADGGGIAINGSVGDIVNSTISNNSAFSEGGGISSQSTTLTVINSTIVSNIVSGRYAESGGGILGDIAWLANSIVAANTAADGSDIAGTIGSNGHNLFSQAGISGATADDIVVAANTVFMSILAPLADNGDRTLTFGLLPDSVAIDAGADADAVDANGDPLSTDQRGAVLGRPRRYRCRRVRRRADRRRQRRP